MTKLNVVFVSQNDPFYTKYFFDRFVELKDKLDYNLVGVYLLAPMNDSLLKLIRRTYNFYGPSNFLRMGLRYVLVKFGEKLGLPTTTYNLLKHKHVPVALVKDVNDSTFLASLTSQQVDIVVSVSCPQIFKGKLLSLPKLACLNIHSGKIPAYRGLFPNFWQMLNNEVYATVTIHKMEAQIDKGNIVFEQRVAIHGQDTLTDLIKNTKYAAVDALNHVISLYAQGPVPAHENSDLEAHYYKFPAKNDVKLFKQKGKRII